MSGDVDALEDIALGVRGAIKSYGGVRALAGVDLMIRRGESVAVLGANGAGKSTVVRVLTGAVHPDEGEVIIDGRRVHLHGVRDARRLGVGYVPQELAVVEDLTIAENMLTAGWRRRGLFVDHRRGLADVGEICERIGLAHAPTEVVRHLNGAEQRLVMIGRSLIARPTTLILDEPTAALAEREAERVVHVLNELRGDQISLVYISHRMSEIARLTDRVVVLRNGLVVMEGVSDADTVARAVTIGMAGGENDLANSDQSESRQRMRAADGRNDVVLACRSVTTHAVRDISMEVHRGEIVGLAGLLGSGRTEILRALAGADRVSSGVIERNGVPVTFKGPRDAIDQGIALLPEDRRNEGGLLSLSVSENLVIPDIPSNRFGWLRRKQERQVTTEAVRRYGIKCSSVGTPMHTLSGGNQQKVILGRWMLNGVDVLLLDEPTAGIDVVAKRELMMLVRATVEKGAAAVMVSSELEDLTEYCDRIYVLRDGTIGEEVAGDIDISDLAHRCDQVRAAI
jgi:ABC-type sugar transport system ATPase subunit